MMERWTEDIDYFVAKEDEGSPRYRAWSWQACDGGDPIAGGYASSREEAVAKAIHVLDKYYDVEEP